MRGYWPPPIWVPAEQPATKWLGRWGGVWIGLGGLGFFLYLMLVDGLLLRNGDAITIGLLVGSVTVAVSFIYTLAYRLVPRDTLTLSRLLLAFGLGGLIAVTMGSSFDSLLVKATGGTGTTPGLTVLLLAGVSEELAKILAVVLLAKGLTDKSPRNGLFLGGAVGFGFAALEDLSYAINFYNNPVSQLHISGFAMSFLVVPLRAAETPFLHPLFTALFAAALFRASRNGRFRITWRVIRAYLGVALAHGLFDGSASLLQKFLPLVVVGLLVLVVYAGIVVVPGLIWLRTARRARWDFQLPVAWWLAPPPLAQAPVAAPFGQPVGYPPLAPPPWPQPTDLQRRPPSPVIADPASWALPTEQALQTLPTDAALEWPPPSEGTEMPDAEPPRERVGRHVG